MWTQGAVDQLPTSLVELCAVMGGSTSPPSNYTHLTALQRLSVHHAVDGLALPRSTTCWGLEKCSIIEPLLALQQVQSLRIWYCDLFPMGPVDGKVFQQLVAGMPNLQEIHLGLQQKVGNWGRSVKGELLWDLSEYNTPKLRSLCLAEGGLAAAGLEALMQFTQLTSLVIQAVQIAATPEELCNNLKALTDLEFFVIWVPEFRVPTTGRFGPVEHPFCTLENEEALAELVPCLICPPT